MLNISTVILIMLRFVSHFSFLPFFRKWQCNEITRKCVSIIFKLRSSLLCLNNNSTNYIVYERGEKKCIPHLHSRLVRREKPRVRELTPSIGLLFYLALNIVGRRDRVIAGRVNEAKLQKCNLVVTGDKLKEILFSLTTQSTFNES